MTPLNPSTFSVGDFINQSCGIITLIPGEGFNSGVLLNQGKVTNHREINGPIVGTGSVIDDPIPCEVNVDDLIDLIESKNLPNNVKNSLLGPLKQVSHIIDDGNPNNNQAACDKLSDFIDNVNSKEAAGHLNETDATELRDIATQIQTDLGC